ncbi:hypothetical protein PflCFBP13510_07675 [Pseudomonas fluorescens]|nr:hypothetical protein CDH05_14715 [Pseudomonas lactis]TKK12574.1 hypothetical protein PflCFBP13510_07675 [Pseudomonas fluorescens]
MARLWHQHPVGASLLAKNLRAPRSSSLPALSLTFFASTLAPTEIYSQPLVAGVSLRHNR